MPSISFDGATFASRGDVTVSESRLNRRVDVQSPAG